MKIEKFLNKMMKKKAILGYEIEENSGRITIFVDSETAVVLPKELEKYDIDVISTGGKFEARRKIGNGKNK